MIEERSVYEFKIPEDTGLKFDEVVQALESKSYKDSVVSPNVEQFVRDNE